ncbi:MAG: molybdenum cofactor guanylyltransferase [Flavobacterium sp.]
MENKAVTAYILAGGKSQRMGTDKGFLEWNGQTFIALIVAALVPMVGDNIVIISSNERYDALGFTRIPDIVANKGPLGGIYTALKNSATKRNLILSVDVPLISSELIQWLVDSHDESYLLTQVAVLGKPCPLVAVYDRSVRQLLPEFIASNQLKVREFVNEITHQTLEVPEKWKNQLQNINTPEEYKNIVL